MPPEPVAATLCQAATCFAVKALLPRNGLYHTHFGYYKEKKSSFTSSSKEN
jgi:hypothetical protein